MPTELLPAEKNDADPLYLAACAVEQDEALAAEMAVWERVTLSDGLAPSVLRKARG